MRSVQSQARRSRRDGPAHRRRAGARELADVQPAEPGRFQSRETRRDRVLTDPYEPGSTIKPFIAGPAFAWNVTRPTEIFKTGKKWYTPYHRMIEDVHGYDQLAMWDVLVKSSNIGMSQLGERMGNPRLHEALSSFRFGTPTGIELPGEDPGRLNPLKQWNKFSTESISQGYEIMVTPMQLARGFCAYANGGRLVQPHIVKGVLDEQGNVIEPREARAAGDDARS